MDDSRLYLSFPVRDLNTIVQRINEDFSLIASCCYHNHLLINPDKTKLLVMGTCQKLQTPPDFNITLLERKLFQLPVLGTLVCRLAVIFSSGFSIFAVSGHVNESVNDGVN